jgi:hypothetical protein
MVFAGICAVCAASGEVVITTLPFAAISMTCCSRCLSVEAYPLWAIYAAIDTAGGLEFVQPWFYKVRSFDAGEYIGWDQIVASYRAEGGTGEKG